MKDRKTRQFRAAGYLAMRPEAMGLYWYFGCGTENYAAGNTTVVTIDGPVEKTSCWHDGYDTIQARFAAALADEATDTVLLDICSPGGECAGLFDAIRRMQAAKDRSGKRVVAFANGYAFSAGYALACVADEIYTSPDGELGSVGVIACTFDRVAANEKDGYNVRVVYAGAHKADSHPDEPLSDEAVAALQSDVDALAGMFFDVVAAARDVTPDDVSTLEAATFMGDACVDAGLADGIMWRDELLAMLADDNDQTNSEATMGKKNSDSIDAMSAANVKTPTLAQFGAIASTLDPTATLAAKAEEKDESAEDEEESPPSSKAGAEDEDASEDEDAADGDEEDDDSEDEDDSDDDEKKKDDDKGARVRVPSGATSTDILKAAREVTGMSKAADVIGALHALASAAERGRKAEAEAKKSRAKNAKASKAALIDRMVKTGKLRPAQRSWASAQTLDVLKGFDAASKAPEVKRQATKPGKAPKLPNAEGAPVDAALAAVAKATGITSDALAKHHAELKAKGLVH